MANSSQLGYINLGDANLGGVYSSPSTPLTTSVSDNLNFPWADAASRSIQAVTPLLITIEDKIIRNGSINGNNLALRDGIGFSVGPSGPVNIAVSDLGIFLDDSLLKIGYGISVAD